MPDTNSQQSHPLAGATLGTEDRGDICIRSPKGDLLYRFVPTLKNQEQPLDEVLRVAVVNAHRFAHRDKRTWPQSPVQQAQALLAQLETKLAGMDAAARPDLVESRALIAKMAQLLADATHPAAAQPGSI